MASTLHAHADSLATLGRAYADLAARHRVVADALAQKDNRASADSEFGEWIFQACELIAAAERLFALEIDLARSSGVTWDAIAEVLGVSRQAAWKRFAKQTRGTRRTSQTGQAQWAGWIRDLRKTIGTDADRLLAIHQWCARDRRTSPPHDD